MSARRRRGHRGYAEFLEALADPLHEEHDNFLVWIGYKFDPSEFNVAAANAALRRVR
jgi:Plasmid pRiA4b ORF-3-like protein